MTPELTLTPHQAIGIPLALLGAVFLSLGAQYQHRGVAKVNGLSTVEIVGGLSLRQILQLLRRPSWLVGTLMLGVAVILQLTSLSFAPLIVVQPLGVLALVITAVVNARVTGVPINKSSMLAIALCVLGIAVFVTIAALVAVEKPISNHQLVVILLILAAVTVTFVLVFIFGGRRFNATGYILGAGVLYGFIATLAKVVIVRVQQREFEWLTLFCLLALLAAAGLGAYFVQAAYASGPPELVIAGLTVVDPVIAVGIGIVVLGEATNAGLWQAIGFAAAAAAAVTGVFLLSRFHPQTN